MCRVPVKHYFDKIFVKVTLKPSLQKVFIVTDLLPTDFLRPSLWNWFSRGTRLQKSSKQRERNALVSGSSMTDNF